MSLMGNLEDLSLPDLLQIVSLSRKSGILTLEREGQQGRILIREGRVIQTVSARPGRNLGELLTGRGLLRADDLRRALEIQRAGENREILGAILVRLGLIDEATLEKVVQGQIEEAIAYFLSWKEGTFRFDLADIQSRGEFSVDPQAFILEHGIDTQWLVLEGSRQVDEGARGGGSSPASKETAEAWDETSFAGVGDEPEVAAAHGRALILVDDDPAFLDLAREHLGRLGERLIICEGAASCLAAIEREAGRGALPAVATGVAPPTSGARGPVGGLELIDRLRRAHPEVPVVAFTAHPDEKLKAHIREAGGALLLRPGTAGAHRPAAFFELLAEIVEERSAAPTTAPAAELSAAEEILLRDMLEELRGPQTAGDLGLLILRFAAELMNRAVLFEVRDGEAVGLGGFGVEAGGAAVRRSLREIAIPLEEPSLLATVVQRRRAVRGPVDDAPLSRALLRELGGKTPVDAAALPLVSFGRVRLILYGDNLPDARPVAGTRALEMFLERAGLMLERSLLERRLGDPGSVATRASGAR